MDTSTHMLIAEAIADALNFPEDWKEKLSRASIAPDMKRGSRRHHGDKRGGIEYSVLYARQYYLVGNIDLALSKLGEALHYIQDMFVDIALHNYTESKISSITTPVMIEYSEKRKITNPIITDSIRKGLNESKCSLLYVLEKIKTIKPQRNPEKALSLACEYSAAIVKAVMTKSSPNKVIAKGRKLEKQYKQEVLKRNITFLIFFYIALLGICVSVIAGNEILCVASILGIISLSLYFLFSDNWEDWGLAKKYFSKYPKTISEYIWYNGKFADFLLNNFFYWKHYLKKHS